MTVLGGFPSPSWLALHFSSPCSVSPGLTMNCIYKAPLSSGFWGGKEEGEGDEDLFPSLQPSTERWLPPCEQGSFPERSYSYKFVPSHTSLIRGDLPNKPVESHTGYTQRRGADSRSKQGECLAGISVTGGVRRLRGWCWSQALKPVHPGGVQVPQASECDPWYSQSPALGGWSSEFL